MVNNSTISSKM